MQSARLAVLLALLWLAACVSAPAPPPPPPPPETRTCLNGAVIPAGLSCPDEHPPKMTLPSGPTAGPSAPATIPTLSSVPKASTSILYEKACLENGTLAYQRIVNRLYAILSEHGYANRRRFLTPSGFGIATAFERIADNGQSATSKRWDTTPFYNSLWEILAGDAEPGRYRSFIIIFGPSIAEDTKPKVFADMAAISGNRDFALPDDIKTRKGTSGDHLEVFIYDYERPALHQKPVLVTSMPASEHMARSGLGPKLTAICGRTE